MTVGAKGRNKKRKPFPLRKKNLGSSTSEPLTLKDTVTKWSGFYSKVSELNLTGALSNQNLDLEIHESDFFRRLRQAQEENYSATFQTFTRDVFQFKNSSGSKKSKKRTTDFTDCSQSLAIFLYNREYIYETLIQGLEKNELADLGSLYNVSVGFFVDASLTKEVDRYFDGFMRIFESSLSQRSDASVVQVIFQCLLGIVKELLKNSNLTTTQLSDKLIYLFDSNKYPDYVIDFSSVVLAPILRKNKFNPEEVLKSILNTKCNDGIVKVLGRAIKNFGSNFFAGSEKAWSNYLNSIEDPNVLEQLHDFIINSEPSIKEFEPLVKLTVKSFLSNPCKFSLSFNKLLMRKKAKFVPGDYISKILKTGLSDKLFTIDNEDGPLIVNSLLSLPESKVPYIELKNFIRLVLNGRPQIISQFSQQDDKFDTLILPLFVESCIDVPFDADIMPYVESLASVVVGSSNSSYKPKYKVIEFSTDQPNSLKTFPNRIINLIDDARTREYALKALLGVRPLNKSHLLPKLKPLLELQLKDSQMSFYLTYIFHSLLSSSEFLKLSSDLDFVKKLLGSIKGSKPSFFSFQMLNFICTSGMNGDEDIFNSLIPHLSNGDSAIRLSVLDSLVSLHSNQDERSILEYAFEAEKINTDISNYKERLRLLNYLERRPDGEEESLRSSSALEEIRIRVLLSNLMINFSLLWEPASQLILSFPKNSSDESIFWRIYFEILSQAYDGISRENNLDNVDYVNFRNLLLKICESCPGTQLQKFNRHFVSNFLDKFLANEFNRKRSDNIENDVDDSEEKDQGLNEATPTRDDVNKEYDAMEIDNDDSKVVQDPQSKYFKAVKNVSKSLHHHLKIFSRMSNLRSVFRYSDLHAFIVQNLLSDSFLENRKLALDFVTVAENKKISQSQRDVLTALADKKTWKSSLRDFVIKFNDENEIYSPISWITNKFITGMLKETRHMKRTSQMSSRKTIMEIISKFKNFDQILDEILNDMEKTDFWELSFDVILIARQYLSTSDNLASRAIHTIEKNFPYSNSSIKKSKERYKAIEVYTRLIETLRNQYIWPMEVKRKFMETCILPLFVDIYERRNLSKNALNLFKALINNSLEWMIIPSSKSLLDHALKDLSENSTIDTFYKLNLNIICQILERLMIQEGEGFSEHEKDLVSEDSLLLHVKLALPIISSINLKVNLDDINLRLHALSALLTLFPQYKLSHEELDKLCDHVASKIRFSSMELQAECLQIVFLALKKLDHSTRDQIPNSVYKLIPKVQDPNQRSKLVEKIFSLLIEQKEFKGHEVAYDICQNYDQFNLDETSSTLKVFLFYNALAEVKRSEFANRRMGSNCILGLLQSNEEDLIRDYVLPEIVWALGNRKSSSETIAEIITILQFLLKNYSNSIEDLKILSQFTNVHDMDEDFYANVKHLQSVRRSRAIKRMAKKIVELEEDLNDKTMRVIFDYIYPLISAVLFNEKTVKYSELIESSIDLIGSIAKRTDFNRYKKILVYYLGMDKSPEESSAFMKQRIKLIAKILDSFHFESQSVDFLLSKIFSLIDSGSNQANENSSHEILYLPIVKLLQVSKSASTDEYTSRIIVKLAKGLRMREFSTRERIRSTLNSIARLLGHNYFAYIIDILESTLKRGYELHVLIYSVKSMIIACSKDLKSGYLDSLLPSIIKFTRLELFDSVKEEKSVSKIRTKTPEAKKISSFSAVEVLAQFASRSISMKVIEPFANFLHEFKSFDALENLRKLFKHISDGFAVNESIQTLDLLAIIHAVLNGKLFSSPEQNLSSRQTTVLVEFALLLLTRILNGTANLNSSDFASFIPIILDKCQKIRDTEVISLTISIFNRCVHMSESFRDLVPVNDVFTIIVRALIVESLYSKEQDKIKFQDLASSFLNGYLEKGGNFKSQDKESVKLFLEYILDSKSIGSRTAKLLGAVIKQGYMNQLNKNILERLSKDYIQTVDVGLMRTLNSAIMNYLKSNKNADWIIQFLLQQFHYGGEKGRLRAMKMLADVLAEEKIQCKTTSHISVFVMVAKTLAEEKITSCIEALRSILNSLRCSDKDLQTISKLLQSWISSLDSNHLIVGAKTIFQISKTENKQLINVVSELSEKLKAFIEKDDFGSKLSSKSLIDHVKVDFLTSLYKTCKKKTPEFFTWLLPLIDKFVMNSKSNLRRLAIELLSFVMSEVPSVMNPKTIEENKGIFRQILLNLMEVLKLNLSICDEDLFEKVSIALIYFSKTTDPMLIIGKLIGVARFEVEHLTFSYKRREILFTVVGVLCSKWPLSENMLRSILKMGRALIEQEEMSDMVEELYNKLEASTDNPEFLKLISNTRNRVDIMEGKLKRRAGQQDSKFVKAKKKKT